VLELPAEEFVTGKYAPTGVGPPDMFAVALVVGRTNDGEGGGADGAHPPECAGTSPFRPLLKAHGQSAAAGAAAVRS
jgi:hypothetical protein